MAKPSRPALAEPIDEWLGMPTFAATDEKSTILPPDLIIMGMLYFIAMNAEVKFRLIVS